MFVSETHGWTLRRYCRQFGMAAGIVTLAVSLMTPAALFSGTPQQKQRNKKESESTGLVSPVPLPDAQAVDLVVSQMLGAWQIGDVQMLHKSYADDVVIVSGAWEPPVMGWESYAKAYQAQYARTAGSRMDRSNSFIKVAGDNAWVTYQWQFNGQVDGNPTNAVGQTTLVLQKRAGAWVIVLNHTSSVPTGAATSQAVKPQPVAPLAVPQK